MALEHCKECEKKVSEQASVCPKCNVNGCYEKFTWPEKYRGMCALHYQKDLNTDSFWWVLVVIVVLFLIF